MAHETQKDLHRAVSQHENSGSWPIGTHTRAPRILVVDDNAQVTRVLARVLRAAGFDVSTALSGGQALELVVRQKFDAVLTDLIMTDTNGLQLSRTIREMFPDMPVVLVTGDTGAAAWISELEERGLRCMTKPLPNEALKRVLIEMIRERSDSKLRPTLRETPSSRRAG